METGDALIGYVVCQAGGDGTYLGGALITDAFGLPLEFRHTEPLQPTRLQRVLYGRTLDTYLYNEVVITALLDALESLPKLMIAGDAAYLAGVSRRGIPTAWLSEARNVPAKEIGTRQDLSREEYVLNLGPGNGAVRVRVRPGPDCAADAVCDQTAQVLIEASQTMEVLEPLRRVDDALKMIIDELASSQTRVAA